jgi:Coenzyme PQQ synthesis protein D (PqqD)
LGFECSVVTKSEQRGQLYIMATAEKFIRTQAVAARVLAGETLIVPVRAKVGDLASIYKFNSTGTLIWKLLEISQTLEDLSAAVARHYEVEAAQAERDVAGFLNEMRSVGLVEVASALAMAGD